MPQIQSQPYVNATNPHNPYVGSPILQQYNVPSMANNTGVNMNIINPNSTFGLQNLLPHQPNRRR